MTVIFSVWRSPSSKVTWIHACVNLYTAEAKTLGLGLVANVNILLLSGRTYKGFNQQKDQQYLKEGHTWDRTGLKQMEDDSLD